MKRFFSQIFTMRTWSSPEGKIHKSLGATLWLVPQELFYLLDLSTRVSNISSVTVCFPAWHWCMQRLLHRSFCWSRLWFSVFACWSPIYGVVVCSVFSDKSKKSCWCFEFSEFFLWLGPNGDFQAPYMLGWKLKVVQLILTIYFI